jgi:hypothetical protein
MRKEQQLKTNQDKELSLLGEKQQSAIGTINKRYTEHERPRTNQLKAKELGQSLTRCAGASARRLRSVTRSQASSRPCQLLSKVVTESAILCSSLGRVRWSEPSQHMASFLTMHGPFVHHESTSATDISVVV